MALLVRYESSRPLGSSCTALLTIPRPRTKHGESAFWYYAPKAWNKLPLCRCSAAWFKNLFGLLERFVSFHCKLCFMICIMSIFLQTFFFFYIFLFFFLTNPEGTNSPVSLNLKWEFCFMFKVWGFFTYFVNINEWVNYSCTTKGTGAVKWINLIDPKWSLHSYKLSFFPLQKDTVRSTAHCCPLLLRSWCGNDRGMLRIWTHFGVCGASAGAHAADSDRSPTALLGRQTQRRPVRTHSQSLMSCFFNTAHFSIVWWSCCAFFGFENITNVLWYRAFI